MKYRVRCFLFILLCIFSFEARALMAVIDYSVLAQLGSQLEQLRQQTLYIQTALKRLESGQYRWSNTSNLMRELGQIIEKTQGIAYSASDLDKQFKSAYPGYVAPEDFSLQYKSNANTLMNTLQGVMGSLNASHRNFKNEGEHLSFLEAQVQSAEGQTQAIQASAQMTGEVISQIQALRQTVMAQTNAQTAYYATEVQNEASAHAELSDILQSGKRETVEYGHSGSSLKIPQFN
ncbi:MAG: hypothetical protein JSS53_01620 [Proteobacteria bacterium]|nr:hypothetical protein [Pseudomonadota bacterium]